MGHELLAAARDDPAAALSRLKSRADGLDAADAAQRLARDGPNEVQHEPPLPGWLHLWRCYVNPFNLLLTALAALSFFSGDVKATVVIGVMVGLSTVIRFVQEGRSHRSAEGLRAMVSNKASVMRRNAPPVPQLRTGADTGTGTGPAFTPVPASLQEIDLRELVAGDVVALSAGDMIPADCRLLTARDLFVAQAAITGESLPVEKFVQGRTGAAATAAGADATGPLDHRNLVFMGTNVVSGTATALVVATGGRSCFGTLAAHATATESVPNAFQAGVNSVRKRWWSSGWTLCRISAPWTSCAPTRPAP